MKNNLEAVRRGPWKLHVLKKGEEMRALYHLEDDPCETENLADQNPEVVKELDECLEAARADLGDDATNRAGAPAFAPKGKSITRSR